MINKTGVTLIELLIVVLILSVLAAIAIPRINQNITNAKEKSCQSNLKIIDEQIELYTLKNGAAPKNINVIIKDTALFPDGEPECPLGGKYKLKGSIKRAFCTHKSP